MDKMTKREKREMIAAAMKAISEQPNLSPAARKRGLDSLQRAYEKSTRGK